MSSIVSTVFNVFTDVSTWFVDALASVVNLFYSEGNLTFLGVMALVGLGIGVTRMVIAMVTSFIQFKGGH